MNSTDSPPNRGPARKLGIAVAMPPWFDVPPDAHTALMDATSKGRYHHYYIKRRYSYRRLRS